ncbi:MAG: hypothetical protein JSV91_04785, partial [Phycisphaerales bacterium]
DGRPSRDHFFNVDNEFSDLAAGGGVAYRSAFWPRSPLGYAAVMWMYICGISVLVVVLLFVTGELLLAWIAWHRGNVDRLAGMRPHIACLARHGYDRSMLRIDNRDCGHGYVDLVKQEPRDGAERVVAIVRANKFSEEEYSEIGTLLKRETIPFDSERDREHERIVIDCGTDAGLIVRLCELVFVETLGISDETLLRCRWKGRFRN